MAAGAASTRVEQRTTEETTPRDAQAEVSGIVLFNVMYGIFVSTWLVEKRPDVSVKRVIYDSAWACFATFVVFGACVGAALHRVGWNALLHFGEPSQAWPVKSSTYLFGIFVIASGVPPICVMASKNLESAVDPNMARFLGAVVPFLVTWLLAGSRTTALLNISGTFVVAPLVLVLPFLLRLCAERPLGADESVVMWLMDNLSHLEPQPYEALGEAPDESLCEALCFPEFDGATCDPLPVSPWFRRRRRRIYCAVALVTSVWILFQAAYLINSV